MKYLDHKEIFNSSQKSKLEDMDNEQLKLKIKLLYENIISLFMQEMWINKYSIQELQRWFLLENWTIIKEDYFDTTHTQLKEKYNLGNDWLRIILIKFYGSKEIILSTENHEYYKWTNNILFLDNLLKKTNPKILRFIENDIQKLKEIENIFFRKNKEKEISLIKKTQKIIIETIDSQCHI